MAKTLIVTDSASDISIENEQKYGIRVLPFEIAMMGKSYTSRKDFDNRKFYELLEACEEIPATSQITPFTFQELYHSFYEEGYSDVILILINAEGSATYGNAVLAEQLFRQEHPQAEIRIHPIDSRTYTGGYGHIAVKAAQMAQQGMPAAEILAAVNDWLENALIYAGLYTLKYAAKSGRIPSAAAFVGDMIGMKPIMRIFDHQITTGDKVRGEKNIIPFIVKKTVENIEPGSEYCVVYGTEETDREEMTAAVTKALGYPPADVYQIGAAIAINAGPRVVGTIFKQKK